jgi:hypothetical protein
MPTHMRRPWGIALVAGLAACAALGATPVRAQSVPVVVPPIAPIVVGVPAGIPSVAIGIPGTRGAHSRSGVTWSTSGRADVDVDVARRHGQAATR